MKAFIKSLDYFSKKFDFKYNGKDRYNTVLGGAITILSTLIIVLNAWLIGKDIYLRENPVVLGYEQALAYFPTTRINYNDIFFSFFLSDNLNNPYDDESVLKIIPLMYLNYYDKNGNLKYKEKFLEYTDCNSEFRRLNITPPLSPSVFLPLKCIKNFDEVLSGFWTDTQLSYLMFKAHSCSNITIEELSNIQTEDEIKEFKLFENNLKNANIIKINSFPKDSNDNINSIIKFNSNNVINPMHEIKLPKKKTICKSPHEIKKIIPTLYFNFFFSSILLNPKNYTNPMIIQINEDWFNLGTSIFKNIDYFFQNYVVRTDDGLIFSEDYKDINKIGYHKHFADYLLREEGQTKIFWLNVYISNQIKYYTREYLKVQSVFANLGGIIQVVLIAFKIFFSPYFNKKLNLKIINEMFDFDEIPEDGMENKNGANMMDCILKIKKNEKTKKNNKDIPSSNSIYNFKAKKKDFVKEEFQEINNTNNIKSEISEQNNFYSREYLQLERNTKILNYKENDQSNILITNFKNLKNYLKNTEIKSENFCKPNHSPKRLNSILEENQNYLTNDINKNIQDFLKVDKTKNKKIIEKDFLKIKNKFNEEVDKLGEKNKYSIKNFYSNEILFNDRKLDFIKINKQKDDKNLFKKNERKRNSPQMKKKVIPVIDNNYHLCINDLAKNKELNDKIVIFNNKIDQKTLTNDITGKRKNFSNIINDNENSKYIKESKLFGNKLLTLLSNDNKQKNKSFDKKISNTDFPKGLKFIKESSKSDGKNLKYSIPKIINSKNETYRNNEIFLINRNNTNTSQKNLGNENIEPFNKLNDFLDDRIERAIDFKERKMKFKNLEIFKSIYFYICCKNKKLQEKNKIYNFAEKNLNKFTDYLLVIKNLQDLTKMKYILFNTNQIYSFPFLSNPKKTQMGVHHENQEYSKAFDAKLSKKQLAIKMFDYFKKKIREDKLDGFDKKIWNILDPKIKNLFLILTYEDNFNLSHI